MQKTEQIGKKKKKKTKCKKVKQQEKLKTPEKNQCKIKIVRNLRLKKGIKFLKKHTK